MIINFWKKNEINIASYILLQSHYVSIKLVCSDQMDSLTMHNVHQASITITVSKSII